MSDVPAPDPGASARRKLERLRRARLARGDAMPSAYERAYEKGAAGELELGRWLNAAAAERGGCWVLHDLVLPGQRRNIDHLVVGPAGVTAIDAKKWEGKVWIGRLGLGRGRRAFPHEIDGMSRQINRVHSLLAKRERDNVRIEGVICMVNGNEGIPARGFAEVRGVKISRPASAIRHALRDGPCDLATIEQLARMIESEFTAQGGSQAPTARMAPAPMSTVPRRSCRFPFRGARRLALAFLAGMIVLTAVAAVVSGLDASVNTLTKPYRTYTLDDLRADAGKFRAIATRRAHGSVRGPKRRTLPYRFELTYRRGKHCRVVVTVPRLWPALGGGKPDVTARRC